MSAQTLEMNVYLEDLFESIRREAEYQYQQGNFNAFKEKYLIDESTIPYYRFNEKAKILIIGMTQGGIKTKDIQGLFKNEDIPKQFEIIPYEDMTNFNIKKLEYTTTYSDIMIGACPHSIKGMDGASSGIEKMLSDADKYPKIHLLRKSNGDLGITKTNLRQAIAESALKELLNIYR